MAMQRPLSLAASPVILVLAGLCFGMGAASAAVEPAALFSDNAVLQADREVPVWGRDQPGQAVTVSVGQVKASGQADASGRWEVRLPAMKADDKPQELVITGSSTKTIANVLIGEVWVGSGQSNMAMPLDWGVFGAWGTPECTKGFKETDYPKLRMFTVAPRPAGEAAGDLAGSWQICAPMATMKWSATGYFFGRELHKELGGTPVGFICSAVGGTPIAPWISRQAMDPAPNAKTQEQWAANGAKMAEYEAQVAEAAAKAKAAGGKEPARPKAPVGPWPSSLYNGMIAPLMPYAIRGVAWYQGESNTGAMDEEGYAKSLTALITSWRAGWKRDDLPFIVVQLPNYSIKSDFPKYVSPNSKPVQADPIEKDAKWPLIREAQRRTVAALANTALLVAIDIGNPAMIHPTNKADLGRRLALLALPLAYGKKDLVASGPLFAGCAFKDGKVIATFTSIGGGLEAKGGGEIAGFAIAGADGAFVWAKATVEGSTVALSADTVKEPVAVRYDWAENPIGNLINKEGLPASPFRADAKK